MTLTSATSTTQAVVDHHLERFAALDLQGVVADYAPDAVMIVPTGALRGVHEITPLFQSLFAEFAKPGATFDLQQQVIEGDVAYIWWVAETPDNTYELGTDTFSCSTARSRCRPSRSKRRPGPDVREVHDGLTLRPRQKAKWELAARSASRQPRSASWKALTSPADIELRVILPRHPGWSDF